LNFFLFFKIRTKRTHKNAHRLVTSPFARIQIEEEEEEEEENVAMMVDPSLPDPPADPPLSAAKAKSTQISRREARTKLRLMETDIELHREEMRQSGSRKLAVMAEKVDENYRLANIGGMRTREQEMDLKNVSRLASIGVDMSKDLNQNGRSRYTVRQVLNGLTSLFMRGRVPNEQTLAEDDAEFVSHGAMDWAELGDFASKYYFEVETLDFMCVCSRSSLSSSSSFARRVVIAFLFVHAHAHLLSFVYNTNTHTQTNKHTCT
jgi:hypothetical protein